MPTSFTKILCGMLAFTVAGCIPFLTFVDYTPQMPGGHIRTSNCLGKESVAYNVEGIQITSSVSIWSVAGDKAPLLYVFFDIPASFKVELLSRDISVMAANAAKIKRFAIQEFRLPRVFTRSSKWQSSTVSGEVNFQKLTAMSSFAIDVALTGMYLGDIHITLPDMKINDRIVKIPPIDFKQIRRVEVMAPLNC